MPQIPENAQRSPDGNYWWDGDQWQLVDQAQPETPTKIPADAQRSPDGNYWWDGEQWQPVDASGQAAAQPAGEPIAFDLNDYPALKLYAESDSADDVLRQLGIDVSAWDTGESVAQGRGNPFPVCPEERRNYADAADALFRKYLVLNEAQRSGDQRAIDAASAAVAAAKRESFAAAQALVDCLNRAGMASEADILYAHARQLEADHDLFTERMDRSGTTA